MRRLSLGSGLDHVKLADTLLELLNSDPPCPVVECQAAGNEYAWVHISVVGATPGVADDVTPVWVLIIGYPFQVAPEIALGRDWILLPHGSHIAGWQPGIQVTIHIPYDTLAADIAKTVTQIMSAVHHVDSPQSVELALAYQ
jgi:hypothetical protein